jgi:hypothetical protein
MCLLSKEARTAAGRGCEAPWAEARGRTMICVSRAAWAVVIRPSGVHLSRLVQLQRAYWHRPVTERQAGKVHFVPGWHKFEWRRYCPGTWGISAVAAPITRSMKPHRRSSTVKSGHPWRLLAPSDFEPHARDPTAASHAATAAVQARRGQFLVPVCTTAQHQQVRTQRHGAAAPAARARCSPRHRGSCAARWRGSRPGPVGLAGVQGAPGDARWGT